MNDIRLNINFRTHPKIKKLQRELGADGVLALITLWCYAAAHFPRGHFNGMDGDDIEDAALWTGIRSGLLSGLLKLKLLDKRDDGYAIHDWEIHQRYVYMHPERQVQSRKANEARWQKKRGIKTTPDRTPKRNPDRTPKRNPPLPPPPPPPKGGEGNGSGESFVDSPAPHSQKHKCQNANCKRTATVGKGGRWYCSHCIGLIEGDGDQLLKTIGTQ